MTNINPPAQAALQQKATEQMQAAQLLTTYSAGTWLNRASKLAVPKMLFGKFWFQGELCILFADSNLGKSILAVQIGNYINTGQAAEPFTVEPAAQPVLYCDFELSAKQFEARYSANYAHHYNFRADFYRTELNPETEVPNGFNNFDDYLIASLERTIINTNTKVIIIDNLTYLRNETEQAKDALPLMKQMKALKAKYNLSLLVLAHTPKRDLSQQITLNDLQGSKMLMNFCDSAFTIGESSADKGLRYIKQIKQRNTSQEYGYTNVCVCKINKAFNFLQYEFEGYGNELDHLRKNNEKLKDDDKQEAIKLKLEGLSLREIGKRMNIHHAKVDRLLKSATADQRC